jgi:hypothetical protein
MAHGLQIQNIGYSANNNPNRAGRSGEEFERLLPAPDWQEVKVRRNASVEETVKEMQKLIRSSAWQTKELSKRLLGKNLYETCGNIWDFLFSHILYKEDDYGEEQLRTPAVSWAVRRTRGIDCDDFSIFAGSILYNLNIPFYFRIARYEGVDHFQHVYVTVPQLKKRYITIDAVLDEFDKEKQPVETKEFLVMDANKLNGIDVSVLSGISEGDQEFVQTLGEVIFGVDFDGIEDSEDVSGLGEADEERILGAIYNHMARTRNAIQRYPHIVRAVEDPETLGRMLDYGMKYWHTPRREEALGILADREEELNRLNGVDHLEDGMEETTIFYGIEGIGGITALGKAKAKKTFFKNVNKAVTKVKAKAKTAVQKIKKAIVKNNPVSVAARAGMLLAMKTNLLKIAGTLKWGYLTEQEASDHGFDIQEWGKARIQLKKAENLFVDKLKGKAEDFKKAIITGRAGGLNGVSEDLGVVAATAAAASITAAMPFIKKIADFAKAINLSKLVGKVKQSKLFQRKKKAETMEPASEDTETAMPETNESSDSSDNSGGENKTPEIPENAEKSSGDGTNSEGNNESNGQNSDEGGKRSVSNNSSSSEDGSNEGGGESGKSANASESSEANKSDPENPEGGGNKLPATTPDKNISATGDESNVMEKVTEWVKENPGKTALIAGGLVLAFSSGARKAVGLGSVKRKYNKKKTKKKSPKAISGIGKKNKKPKTVKKDQRKKGGSGPRVVRL